jgi:hypothetical protein
VLQRQYSRYETHISPWFLPVYGSGYLIIRCFHQWLRHRPSENFVTLMLFWHLFGATVRYEKVKMAEYEALIHEPIGSCLWFKNGKSGRKSEVRGGAKMAVAGNLYFSNRKAAISDGREDIQVPCDHDAVKN